jgi:hypothetical protein
VGQPFVEHAMGRRLADVARRVEVRLADLQVDDVATGRFQRTGARGRLEGCLGADPVHAAGELHGLLMPPAAGGVGAECSDSPQ